ncbi:MAG: hypothetical protein HOL66_15665 [Rhodospirillaceae bacterium]|nr:hypothetical protein [Rhodospirillaceae bacterium]MBT5245675.1 hypothetical protein [Rhodospirillaceae bacterium]MBT5561226.1 hypothetical protein [Rhodospirillaceae bacterium]MBT6240519.1 hypothetical protein [Rhodospirillaceae bacterium]
MGTSKRIPPGGVVILVVMLLLPGCIPWPVSMALSGISYAASGKSIGDHFLSSFAQKDCSVGRAVLDQSDICQDPDNLAIIVKDIDDNKGLEIAPASGDAPGGG